MVYDPESHASGKCVFSGIMADVLRDLEPAAIVDGLITTTTLGACVCSSITEFATGYHLRLNPLCLVDPESVVLHNTAAPLQSSAGCNTATHPSLRMPGPPAIHAR